MREIKILILVAIITGITYWGVEPYAHHVMHPPVAAPDYTFKDLAPIAATGDAVKGEELVTANCTACHGIEAKGLAAPMQPSDAAVAYGVVPPDLSNAGTIYNETFLANFIKNPVVATHLSHKFDKDYTSGKMYPMPSYSWMSDQDIADMVAYFKSIGSTKLTGKEIFNEACSRCHDMKYDKIIATTPDENIKPYMGSMPPDLSMMIRSRGDHYLYTFINEPQKLLQGTSMPRVGLNKESEAKVVEYMEQIGDSKKDERESLGIKIIIFTVIFTILAYLWKVRIWRDIH
jgi:ubiquinol-cytochrome c reductase cytochrome c1 subunit